jgi:type IV secretory pathway VirB2 component (pilin)
MKAIKSGLYGATLTLAVPLVANASVESSLMAVQSKLIGTILPLAAILGLVFAGLSFVAGSPNARSHLTLAIVGAVVGFGAPSIVSWIQSMIQ